MRTAFILSLVFLQGACATSSPEERAESCASTDWWQFGMTDGTFGVPISRRDDHFTGCAELGQPADIASYRQGHARGVEDYCTQSNGYQQGYDGKDYAGVCPPALEPDFLEGYARGEDDRPSLGSIGLRPSVGVGIGVGPGGVRPHVGIGLFSGCFLFC